MYFSDILSASNFRGNLYKTIKEVVSKSLAIKITSKGGNVVILPEEEYNSMKETIHLMQSPVNAARLQEGIDNLNQGLFVEKGLEELKVQLDQ